MARQLVAAALIGAVLGLAVSYVVGLFRWIVPLPYGGNTFHWIIGGIIIGVAATIVQRWGSGKR
jgi:hypothetical protein